MEPENFMTILGLAFTLGLLHALDVDHLVAVSALASRPDGLRRHPRWYGLRWALGHGTTLLLLGVLVFGVGMAVPQAFSQLAETLVGAVMIAMGGVLIYRLWRQRAANTGPHQANQRYRQHGATAIGAVHGMAGSAPLLALMPAAASGTAGLGMTYLAVFSTGVLLSMLVCASALGAVFARLNQVGKKRLNTFHYSIAGGSILAGAYLITRAF